MRRTKLAFVAMLATASGCVSADETRNRRTGVVDVDVTAMSGADASVFGLFVDNAAPYRFGLRLMAYLRHNVVREAGLRYLLESKCIERQPICFETIDRDVEVAVTFKDGRARYRVNEIASHADLIAGSAFDADGHELSTKSADYVGLEFVFPDGATSLTYRGFAELMRRLQVPPGPGGWSCAAIGDTNTARCHLESAN